jgi:hypothetical protein
MDLLLAEELLLLAYRPNGSPFVELESLDYLLSAAVLDDLAVRGRLVLRDGRLEVTDSAPVGDDELDRTLGRLTTVELAPEFGGYWTSMYTPDRRVRLLRRLADRGAIRHEKRSLLKLIKYEAFPEADPAPRASVRERVRDVLGGAEPDARTVALISLAHAGKVIQRAFPGTDRKRAAELAAQDPIGTMVAAAFKAAIAEGIAKVAGGGAAT